MFFAQNMDKIKNIPAIQIEPNRVQSRVHFSKEDLAGLSDSIKENGLLQPLIVRRVYASKFELISGERRLRAAIMAGFKIVPCLVLNCDEKQAAIFTLVEKMQRSSLGIFEEAEDIKKIINNYNITQEMLAQKLGKNQSTIANKLRLLKLSKEERAKISEANLTERHARALLRLDSEDQRAFALSKIILDGLNVRDTEAFVDSMISENNKNKKIDKKDIIHELKSFIKKINKAIDVIKLIGVGAESFQNETTNYVEYVIKLPKEDFFNNKEIA